MVFKLLNVLGLSRHLNFSFFKKINGRKFTFPYIYKTGQGHLYETEPWMSELFKLLNAQKGVNIFYDFGANTGQTLLKYLSVFGNSGNYFGFEPNPYCVSYLNTLIVKNNIKNASIIPVAVSNFNGTVELQLYSDDPSDSSASIVREFRNGVMRRLHVAAMRLKDCCSDMPGPDLIKVDVEGGELLILEELQEGFLANRPIILLEILPVYNKENLTRLAHAKNILSWGKKNNYKLFQIVKYKNKLKEIVLQTEVRIHSDLSLCDYIFVPQEKSSSFSGLVQQ